MTGTETYTQSLKPTEKELDKVQDGYEGLKDLLDSSTYREGGFYILNKNKIFASSEQQDIRKHRILLEPDKKIELGAIKVTLSKKCYKELGKKNKLDKVYGRKQVLNSQDGSNFNRGHLIAESLIKYCTEFDYYKRENFVMLTNWCNRANTNNHKGERACGMFYFEKIILDTLKEEMNKSLTTFLEVSF